MEVIENQSVNTRIDKECADNLESALRYVNYALTQLEATPNTIDECEKLWKIYRSLVKFKAEFEFLNRLGVWSFLMNTTA